MSAYRSAPERARAARTILCWQCAARAALEPDRETFSCTSCGTEQAAAPIEVRAIEAMERVDQRSAAHSELFYFASSLGHSGGVLAMTVLCDGVSCSVSLELNSGAVAGLEANAATTGLPEVTFRRETDSEVYAKERGVARELQTGDATFDARVFIDTAVADEDILVVLGPGAVRAALLTLLDASAFAQVTLGPAGVFATGCIDMPACFQPLRVRELLAALRAVAGAPRSLTPRVIPESFVTRALTAYAFAAFPAGLVALFAAAHRYEPTRPTLPLLAGIASLLVTALALIPLGRVYRGRSSSPRGLATARIGTMVGTPLLLTAASLALNGALDGSPERIDELDVVHVAHDSEHDTSTLTVRRAKSPLSGITVTISDEKRTAKVGQTLVVYTREGRLGARWFSKNPDLVP